MKILIVDDSRTMRMIVRRTLRQAGYDHHTVYEASNGSEALSAIRDASPDVVLCDWNMPEMSGIDVLTTLRQNGVWTKFGFVTSESTAEMHARALQAGADFFISKPFTAETLQTALDPILAA
jgi:two-component system chemotaxis response regulator CheY